MNSYHKSFYFLSLAVLTLFVVSGCGQFTGLRKPLYDGMPVASNVEAIVAYQASQEILGTEKEFYIRYPFSAEITRESLAYPDEAPLLLEEGTFTIGEEVPAGRATLLGNESVFTSENNVVHAGNLVIRDKKDTVYFENLFHSSYGQLVAQVDLIEGHTIEIIGSNPEITVFYSETLPEDPYLLMDPPPVLVNLDRLQTIQPVVIDEKEGRVQLTAGIYEIGVHVPPGLYEINSVQAPHATELYVFHEGEEVRVFGLFPTEFVINEEELVNEETPKDLPVVELSRRDKIFPSLVYNLELKRLK